MSTTNTIVDVTSVIVIVIVVHFFLLSHDRARYVTLRFVRSILFVHPCIHPSTYLERGDRGRPMRVLLIVFVFLLRVSRDRNLHVCKQTLLARRRVSQLSLVETF